MGYFEDSHSIRRELWIEMAWLQGVKVGPLRLLSQCRRILGHANRIAPLRSYCTGLILSGERKRGLVKGDRIGVDGSAMEASAALRAIVRRDNGETYRETLTRIAKESGVETPTIDDLIRLDRKRTGK
jgi:SRSO17 transposase